MKTYAIKTLGCKVNQYEGQLLGELLETCGFFPASAQDACDLVVVNTCTVTGEADRKSRYEIRKFHRSHPNADIVVTGCYAEREREILLRLPGVREVVRQREKSRFLEVTESLIGNTNKRQWADSQTLTGRGITRFPGKSRAFIKIQDGCDKSCAFCKVVIVRGGLKSRHPQAILDEAQRLLKAGYRELVLAGIQLGGYGKDKPVYGTLTGIMKRVLELEGIERLRLSSINPYDVTDELIELLARDARCCPHLHVPLQSGSNRILSLMRRGYTREQYLERVHKARKRVNQFALTLDCMVGFPGETDEDFRQTMDVLGLAKPLKIHAFPYSRRDAVRANSFPDHIAKPQIQERMNAVFELAQNLRMENLNRWLGKPVSFLVEECDPSKNIVKGITPNYIPVASPGTSDLIGRLLSRVVTGVTSEMLVAA